MLKIDFYILKDHVAKARLMFACKLIEKAYNNQYCLDVRTNNEQTSQQMDDMLWTFREGSFVPHELFDLASIGSPILIAADFTKRQLSAEIKSVLVNLGDDVPGNFDRYQRITEIVSADPVIKQQARSRFQFYRDKGYAPESHNIN